jgi:hypothetical protein
MAFALTGFKTYSVAAFEAVTAQFEQVVEITGTRAATDTALDVGNVAGTFWSAADDSPAGAAALVYWKSILGKAREVLTCTSPQIETTFARVVSGATGAQYQLAASTPTGIAFTLVSGQTLATFKILVRFSLKSGELPVKPYGL